PPPQDYRTPRGFGKPPMPPSHAHAVAAALKSPANTPEITKVEAAYVRKSSMRPSTSSAARPGVS
ncbi:MAG: hypothetical protein ACYCYN_14380, partial [Solirubrobacteraceae bacterium]